MTNARTMRDMGAKVQVYIGSCLVRTYYSAPREVDSMLFLFGINEYGEIYDINSSRNW